MKLLLKILLWVSFIFTVLFGMGIVIISSFSGNTDSWRKQVEEIASSVTGRKVLIGKMYEARLYPEMLFDGEFIYVEDPRATLENPVDENNLPKPHGLIIKKFQFSVPFWSIFWGQPVLKHFLMQDVVFIDVKDFIVEFARIETPENEKPHAAFQGFFKGEPFKFNLELEKVGQGYIPKPDAAFDGVFNKASISGVLKVKNDVIRVDPFEYSLNGKALTGAFELNKEMSFTLNLNNPDGAVFVTASGANDIQTNSSSPETIAPTDLIAQNLLTSLCQVTSFKSLNYSLQTQSEKSFDCGAVNAPVLLENTSESSGVKEEEGEKPKSDVIEQAPENE